MEQTFLDPEENCYPDGTFRNSRRHFAAICPDGVVRRGICTIPDTYFSIPARVKVKGKTVAGFVGCDNGTFTFTPYPYHKNGRIFG